MSKLLAPGSLPLGIGLGRGLGLGLGRGLGLGLGRGGGLGAKMPPKPNVLWDIAPFLPISICACMLFLKLLLMAIAIAHIALLQATFPVEFPILPIIQRQAPFTLLPLQDSLKVNPLLMPRIAVGATLLAVKASLALHSVKENLLLVKLWLASAPPLDRAIPLILAILQAPINLMLVRGTLPLLKTLILVPRRLCRLLAIIILTWKMSLLQAIFPTAPLVPLLPTRQQQAFVVLKVTLPKEKALLALPRMAPPPAVRAYAVLDLHSVKAKALPPYIWLARTPPLGTDIRADLVPQAPLNRTSLVVVLLMTPQAGALVTKVFVLPLAIPRATVH